MLLIMPSTAVQLKHALVIWVFEAILIFFPAGFHPESLMPSLNQLLFSHWLLLVADNQNHLMERSIQLIGLDFFCLGSIRIHLTASRLALTARKAPSPFKAVLSARLLPMSQWPEPIGTVSVTHYGDSAADSSAALTCSQFDELDGEPSGLGGSTGLG